MSRAWILVVAPMFGMEGPHVRNPLKFTIRNDRQNPITLHKCGIQLFADARDTKGARQLPPLISCLAQESVNIPGGGEVTFEEKYQFADFGEMEQIKVLYRDSKTNQQLQHVLDLDTDWVLCSGPINR